MLHPTTPLRSRGKRRPIVATIAWLAGLAVVTGVGLAARTPATTVPTSAPSTAPARVTSAPGPGISPPLAVGREPSARIAVVHGPMGVTVGAGSVWVVTAPDLRLRRVDPATNAVTAVVDLPFVARGPAATALPTASGETAFATIDGGRTADGEDVLPAVAVSADSIWTLGVPAADILVRTDRASTDVLGYVRLPVPGTGVVSGPAGTWVTTDAGMLVRIDEKRLRPAGVLRFGDGRVSAAAGIDATWVSSSDGRINRVDARGRITASLASGGGPIAVVDGSVWVRSHRTLTRIDERTGRVIDRQPISISDDATPGWTLPSVVGLEHGDLQARIAPRDTRVVRTGATQWIAEPERGELWRFDVVSVGAHVAAP